MVSTAVKADVHSAGHGFEPHRLHQGSPYQFARDKSNYLKTCEGTKRDYSDRGYNSYPPCENVVVAAQKKVGLGIGPISNLLYKILFKRREFDSHFSQKSDLESYLGRRSTWS